MIPFVDLSSMPLIQVQRQSGALTAIDLLFAWKTAKEPSEPLVALLATLFALSRRGDLLLDTAAALPEGLFSSDTMGQMTALIQEGAKILATDPEFMRQRGVIIEGSCYYLERYWQSETTLLKELLRLLSAPPRVTWKLAADPALTSEQQGLLEILCDKSLCFLTGGPGTGKTFTAAAAVRAALAADPQSRIILTAPTGKATFQLARYLQKILPSQEQIKTATLHAFLQLKEGVYSEPTPLFADLIVVDESSMIDVELFARLMSAIPLGARVVLIGDPDQLPPVEAGSLFVDLIGSGSFPTVMLTRSQRTDSQGLIALATAARQGNQEIFLERLCLEGWIDLEALTTSTAIKERLWEYGASHFLSMSRSEPHHLMKSSSPFALLSCLRQGVLGVEALNQYFLEQVLRQSAPGSRIVIPVMITKNDYARQLFNGDQGVLYARAGEGLFSKNFASDDFFVFKGPGQELRQLPAWSLSTFQYGYCLSVHKSQGSEYEEVLLLVPPGSEQFGREVIYTGVTRAKKKIGVASTRALLSQALATHARKRSGINRLNSWHALSSGT